MAAYKPKSVKDVPAEEFIKAYAAHLKANDKVRSPGAQPSQGGGQALMESKFQLCSGLRGRLRSGRASATERTQRCTQIFESVRSAAPVSLERAASSRPRS